MEQNRLENGITEIKKLQMTSGEKEQMLRSILQSAPQKPKSIPSPYTRHIFISIFSKKPLIYSLSAFCLVVILSGGTAFASKGSLPGHLLYPLKVNVVEPAQGALIFSPLAKVEYESSLAERRLTEAETLASMGELDEPKEEEINALLENHTIAFNEGVNNLRQNKDTDNDKNDEIVTNFQATMNAHARILNSLTKHRNDTDTNIDTEIKQEIDTKISKKAKDNAKRVRENYRNQEKNLEQKKEEEKKQDPQIQPKPEDQNPEKIESESKSSAEDARERFLDAQSSAKEASIFLKAGAIFKSRGF